MKRFTVLFTILGVLAFWAGFQTWSEAGSTSKAASDLPKVYDATGAMQEAINPKSADVSIAPVYDCLLYTSPSPRDRQKSRMPSSA